MTNEENVMVDMEELIRYVETLSKVNASGHKVDSELKKAVAMLSDLSGVTSYHDRVHEEADEIARRKKLPEFTTRELMWELKHRKGIRSRIFLAEGIHELSHDDFTLNMVTKEKDIEVLVCEWEPGVWHEKRLNSQRKSY